MEGLLNIETGPKKGLFSLKSKKKFHAVLSGTVLVYTREGETSPAGSIVFTTDTIVEGSPKGKRLISIKNKSGEWDLICPDSPTYGKWMDAIALVFRELHVDPEKFSKMVNAAEDGEEEDTSSVTSSTAQTSTAGTESASAHNSLSSSTGALDSDASPHTTENGAERKSGPPRPAPPEKPTVPTRPHIPSMNSSDGITRAESRPEVPPKPPRPEIPQRLDRAPSSTTLRTGQLAAPAKNNSPSTNSTGTQSSPTTATNPPSPISRGSSPPPMPVTNPPSVSIKKGPRPNLPSNVPNLKDLQAMAGLNSLEAPLSPTSPSSTNPSGSLRLPLSARTHSVSTGSSSSQISPRAPYSGRLPAASVTSPTQSSIPDHMKRFVVWMPKGLKHGAFYNAEFTIRSYLEKICRTRDQVTPDTFLAKTSDGTVLDIDTPLSQLPQAPLFEIWWDTLAPNQTMPPDFAISTPKGNVNANNGQTSANSTPTRAATTTGVARQTDASPSASPGAQLPAASTPQASTPQDTTPPVDHRTKIVREILATEQSYVEGLMKLKEGFMIPLLILTDPIFKEQMQQLQQQHGTAGASGTSSTPAPMLSISGSSSFNLSTTSLSDSANNASAKSTAKGAMLPHVQLGFPAPEVIRTITPKTFEAILGFNQMFCGELAKCKPDAIGAIFKQYISLLKFYSDYSSEYHTSLNVYNKAIRDYPNFSAKLDELRAATGSKLRIEDYIIMPIQRVPRYSLLISDLLKHTPPTHEDYAQLQEVERQLVEIGNSINESVRKSDGARRLREFEEKGVAVDRLITPTRFLVREGPVKVVEQKKKETKHFFLFNDVLVQVKDSSMTKGVDLSLPDYVWPLNLVWIQETDLTVEITGPNGSTMSMKKKKADMTWIRDITQRIWALLPKSESSTTGSSPSLPPNRVGAYTSPSDEHYDGEWLNGLKHGTGRSTLPGSTYVGAWESGKRSGKGTLTYSNKMQYAGDWKADVQHGQGTLSQLTGDLSSESPNAVTSAVLYSGAWVNGSPHGHGTMTYPPSGDVYEGDFYEGRCTGEGKLLCANGVTYQGQWLDDQFDGRGLWTSPDGSSYEGQFRSGVKSGKGMMVYPNGGSYNGEWIDGVRHGKGEFIDVDGSTYDGDWIDDRPEGKGTKTWPDKSKYEGNWFRGMRKGHGKLTYPDGSKYEGAWLDDLPNGIGVYTTADGAAVYNGEWVNGRREGKGVQTYPSTAKYDGQWYSDRFHKTGTFTGAPTDPVKSYEGEWLFGRMSCNKGTLHLQNGDSYRGSFKDGRAHGAGIYTYASGATFTGKWNLGLREGKGTYNPTGDDKAHAFNGSFDQSCNILSSSTIPIFLPPQQPLLLIAPSLESLRLPLR